jgi:L,D-transpeptidase YcbB
MFTCQKNKLSRNYIKVGDILKYILYFILSLLELSGNSDYPGENKKLDSYASKYEPGNISVNNDLVDKCYTLNNQHLLWFSLDRESIMRRKDFKNKLDSCQYIGLDKQKYHYQFILDHVNNMILPGDSIMAMKVDRIFTDAVILYGMDIYDGADIQGLINSDEISPKFRADDEYLVLNRMIELRNEVNLTAFVNLLEPQDKDYKILKSTLKNCIDSADFLKVTKLVSSINQFRWIHHFKLDKFVVVNIPSAILDYYEYESIQLQMKVVVGKPSTRTPRFATYCDKIILFPYWNVPHSIAVKEFLPIFKETPAMVTLMDMQILDAHGNIISENDINWSLYSKDYFPYRIRQSTGCDNALGVMKFNLTSPFFVYMHDTNMKSAFSSKYRYYSHGCIRLEKPFQLADYFLETPVDSNALLNSLNDQIPKTLLLTRAIPVFVVYMTAEVDADQVLYFQDIYSLLNNE